jgi:carotenoid cleavage dioxygenase-like enzyme
MNAFEEQGRIETYFPGFSSYSMGHGPNSDSPVELHRLTIELNTGKIKDEALDNSSCEFPRINERLIGRRNRYGGVAFHIARPNETKRAGIFEAAARYDVERGTRILHPFPAGQFSGEPVFVPTPDGNYEDDGFVFTFVYARHKSRAA